MTAGRDRSLLSPRAEAAIEVYSRGRGGDRSLPPEGACGRPSPHPTQKVPTQRRSAATPKDSDWDTKHGSEDLVQVCSTAPCLDDPKGPPRQGCEPKLAPRPRRTARDTWEEPKLMPHTRPRADNVRPKTREIYSQVKRGPTTMYTSVGVYTAGKGVPAP